MYRALCLILLCLDLGNYLTMIYMLDPVLQRVSLGRFNFIDELCNLTGLSPIDRLLGWRRVLHWVRK